MASFIQATLKAAAHVSKSPFPFASRAPASSASASSSSTALTPVALVDESSSNDVYACGEPLLVEWCNRLNLWVELIEALWPSPEEAEAKAEAKAKADEEEEK